MIKRHIEAELLNLLGEYPVVTILGPRQAGKTTLAKTGLRGYEYSNLEVPETRQFATDDPKAFLAQFKGNVILDEIQRVPELLSYIQDIVDREQRNGQFVLTGSHQLALREAITQSLAGRTSILELLPFSIAELRGSAVHSAAAPGCVAERACRGFQLYPWALLRVTRILKLDRAEHSAPLA